ncbi:MAG TPA: ATP-binding protein [Hyphomicrobiales bacterium]|nr:ATP-binding protein [Hyphomicrobiales bacterium]
MSTTQDFSPRRFPSLGVSLPLAFFICFFIVNAILGYFAIDQVSTYQLNVAQSRLNITMLNQLELEVLRAESGQRGYLLTNLESYAEPYQRSLQTINERLIEFNNSSFDADQRELAAKLQNVVVAKMLELEEGIAAARENRTSDAIQLIFTHQGRDLMQEFSELADQMETYERTVLRGRLQDAQESRTTALYLILTANLLGLVMVFISMNMIRLSQAKERRLLQSLQEANDNLELKVEERTAALHHYSLELKRSNRELQDFAFVASHDLQEPLRKIRAFGDRLSDVEHGLNAQAEDYIRRMQNASSRMSGLIDDLLSFSRITTTAKPFLPVDLHEVIDEVLDDLELSINESDAQISIEPLPTIEADRFQMRQLLQNMLGNAVKFRQPDREVVIKVQAHIDPEENQLRLRIVDNGIGFDENYKDRIFMPFQRLHGKGEYPGTGIGLAICRRIVERHSGTITVTSTEGQGSVFTVTLPLSQTQTTLEESV